MSRTKYKRIYGHMEIIIFPDKISTRSTNKQNRLYSISVGLIIHISRVHLVEAGWIKLYHGVILVCGWGSEGSHETSFLQTIFFGNELHPMFTKMLRYKPFHIKFQICFADCSHSCVMKAKGAVVLWDICIITIRAYNYRISSTYYVMLASMGHARL